MSARGRKSRYVGVLPESDHRRRTWQYLWCEAFESDTLRPSSQTHNQLGCSGAFNQWRVGDNTPSVFICIMTTGNAWWLILMTRGPACPCPAC